MRDLGKLYHEKVWILPKVVYSNGGSILTVGDYTGNHGSKSVEIKNENLKIKASFHKSDRNWCTDSYPNKFVFGSELGVEFNGKLYNFYVEMFNLLGILSEYGVTEDGYLNGTYKLSNSKSDMFYLIPEGTQEEIWKTEITSIYRDTSKKFTKKFVPGNVYVGKSGNLFICLFTNLDMYLERSKWFLDLQYSLNFYTETPTKAKLLVNLDTFLRVSKSKRTDSVQNYIINFPNACWVSSDNYAGKDLGPVLIDDGRKIEDIAYKIEDCFSFGFLNKIVENCPKVKERFLKNISNSYLNLMTTKNPDLKKLYDRLRV